MWSVCIVSAGIINFERFRGTLVYLCSGSISPVRVLAAIVSSASIVGLAALPLSWLVWALVTLNPQVTDFSELWPRYVLGVPPAVGCLSVGYVHDCGVLRGDTERYRLRGAVARAGVYSLRGSFHDG